MNADYDNERERRDFVLMNKNTATLRKLGIGWLCMGRGLKIHAMSPKLSYDHWEFASAKGYGWLHDQERQRRDWLVRGSTGISRE